MSAFQILQVVLAIVAAVFAALHKKLPRLLGFILMGVAGAAMIVVGIIGMSTSNEAPYLLPLGIACVIGAVIAAIASKTSSPYIDADTAGGSTETLPGWATAVIGALVVVALIIGGVLAAVMPHR
jgi:hypothetical protein